MLRTHDKHQSSLEMTDNANSANIDTEGQSGAALHSGPTCTQEWWTMDSSSYFISIEQKSWRASRQSCLEKGAALVIINSR
ncbi:unnamed protein product [Coregonus sp. 'balchen']|nr:unnamed protein product [Coregonus sp. 'balchen']